ncbi:MAG TPA: marine proteobacterial sortase target protein, partial [Methylomirabilota bacterium]|nr:marine proteobacterial sortase target protein [Methylomirabilota bacterium]
PAADWAEALYVFPLPDNAAVDHLRMQVGDRVIEGVIQERQAARAQYEQARQQGRRASLVEQERPNVFTTSVANIPPGAAVNVEIEYQQTVRYDAGAFHLRFPMVVGPRYVPAGAVPDAARITPPVQRPDDGPLNPLTLRIELDPGVPVTGVRSPHHAIDVTPLGDGRFEVTLAAGAVPADRDFELVWEPVAGAAPAATLLTEAVDDDVFALLMVTPPTAAALAAVRPPREVVFVLDNSGSMHGASIEQAKSALKLALGRLTPADSFNVIRFNHTTDALYAGARPATPAGVAAAARWVEAIDAGGGTEMLPALRLALDGAAHGGRLRQVIFLTDGGVGNERQLFDAIAARLGDSRLFTIGIGSAPNSHFMREAARLGRGTFTYIGSPAEVQVRMLALFAKLEAPALADVELELAGLPDAEVYPWPLPDLYLGEPLVVLVKGRTLPTLATLRGTLGGAPWQHEVALRESEPGAGLSVQWARAKIDALLDAERAGAAPAADVRANVVNVALRHHLVSAYTSLVAMDVTPARPDGAALARHALKTNLPQGWDYEAVFGLGQGATDAPLHLLLGAAALALASLIALYGRRRAALALVRRGRRA